jgi:hypothetical protein
VQAVVLLLLLGLSALPAADPRPGLRTFFAFERDLWFEATRASLVLEPLEKHLGNPVIARGGAGAVDAHRVSFTSILPEGRRLRAWYGAMRSPGPGKSFDLHRDVAVAYAESEDGIRWIKPRLDLAEPGTNVVVPGAFYMTVAPEPDGREGYRGAAAFFHHDVGKPGAGPGATFEFVGSHDGLRWDFTGRASARVRHFESFGLFHRDGRWWVLGQGVPPYIDRPEGVSRRVMFGFHSAGGKDFDLYPRALLAYPANRHFPDAAPQTHDGAGVWDRGRVLLALAGQFWPGGFSATVHYSFGLAYSHDGIRWTEPFPQTPLLMPGSEGSWDDGWVFQVQRPVSVGGRTYVYYVGGDGGNEWSTRAALGLATLRRDGFAAYKPEAGGGQLVTEPLEVLPGETTLYVNGRGPMTVRLLDPYLRPCGEPARLTADGVRTPLADLKSRPLPRRFRIAFTLEAGAALYTFALGPPPTHLPPLDAWE